MFLRFRRQLKSRKPASGTGFLRNRLTSVKIKPAVRLTEDALMLGLEALKESSDVFPPLKSVVGGLVYFLDLSKKMNANKSAINNLNRRMDEIQDSLIRAVPDVTEVSLAQQRAIETFDASLRLLCNDMESILKQGRVSRFLRARKHDDKLGEFVHRLGEADATFMRTLLQSVESKVSFIAVKVTTIEDQMNQNFGQVERSIAVYTKGAVLFFFKHLRPD